MRAPAVCALDAAGGNYPLRPIARGCTLRRPVIPDAVHRRQLTRNCPPIPGTFNSFTHHNCQCNEGIALRERVVGEVPRPTQRGLVELAAEARSVSRRLPFAVPMKAQDFVNCYTGRRRTRYQAALDSLSRNPLDLPREAMVQAFVKAEKFDPGAKHNPAPRMIQARNARYNIRLGCFLRPIEHSLYQIKSPHGLPVIGKGLNLAQRAETLKEKMDLFKEPVVLSVDASRFDQHVDEEVLKIEHAVYNRLCPDPELKTLLKCQLRNKGFTQGGWKYKTRGKRMSGDMNTALGNCLLMIIMVNAAMKRLHVSKYEIFDDGDDCLIIVERPTSHRVLRDLPRVFLDYGHELKMENKADTMEGVEWCQTRPVEFPTGWRMVASWRKILSTAACGVKYWHQAGARESMAFSVGQCLLALYAGTPVIQEYALALCRAGSRLNPDIHYSDIIFKVRAEKKVADLGKIAPEPIALSTRFSFERAWGLSLPEQRAIEKRLSEWTLGTDVQSVPEEVRPGWVWDYLPGTEPAEL